MPSADQYVSTDVDAILRAENKAAVKSALSLVKADVGLANVDNTSDANKPVSTAQASAIAAVDNKIGSKLDRLEYNDAMRRFVFGATQYDPLINTVCVIGGDKDRPHVVGSATALPVFGPTEGLMEGWVADAAYTPTDIVVCGAIGGYDNVVNAIAAWAICTNHSIIKKTADSHSTIIGGSTNVMSADRSTIINSTCSEILSGNYATQLTCYDTTSYGQRHHLIGVRQSKIEGEYSVLVGVNTASIASGTSRVVALGSSNVTATGTASRVVSLACSTVTFAGSSNFVVACGNAISVTGSQYSLLLGNNLSSTRNHAHLRGIYADTPGHYTDTLADRIQENNDCRRWTQLDNKRTTNATQSNTAYSGVTLPAAKISAGTIRIRVTALQDGSADGDNSGNYAVGTWTGEFGFRWDGTNGYFYSASATDGPSSSPTMSLAAIRDDIGVAALPNMALNTGVLRVQVTGKASTTINWVIDTEVLQTLVS